MIHACEHEPPSPIDTSWADDELKRNFKFGVEPRRILLHSRRYTTIMWPIALVSEVFLV